VPADGERLDVRNERPLVVVDETLGGGGFVGQI
jgi:hypothetical protein